MSFKSILASMALGGTLLLGSVGFAESATVGSYLYSGENALQDDSMEWFVTYDSNGNQVILDDATASTITIGDVLGVDANDQVGEQLITIDRVSIGGLAELMNDENSIYDGLYIRGVFEIIQFNGITNLVTDNELTGLFEAELVVQTGDVTGIPYFNLEASSYFAAELVDEGWFADGTNALIAVFEDTSATLENGDGKPKQNDLDIAYDPGTDPEDLLISAMERDATDGNSFWLFGINDSDDYWETYLNPGVNPSIYSLYLTADAGSTGTFGTYNLALSLLDNPTGPDLLERFCTYRSTDLDPNDFGVDDFDDPRYGYLCGDGSLDYSYGDSQAATANDLDFYVNVPEPGTVGLFGLGLLGAAGLYRRRRKAA